MKKVLLLPLLAFSLIACDQPQEAPKEHLNADNTGRNVRDRSWMAQTPFDQAENASDLEITRQIRQSLVSDRGLSNNAKNIKIITINGVVTLRGPVLNSAEREAIANKLQAVRGILKVNNQLETTNNQ